MSDLRPLAIIDSGLGGLAIAQQIWARLPNESTLCFADHVYLPYGDKSTIQINRRLVQVFNYLLTQNRKAAVIACNTITVSAIKFLRQIYPLPIIGTEPAVKPAIASHAQENIVVLATRQTVKSLSLPPEIQTIACPDLVPLIEKYGNNRQRLAPVVKRYLAKIKPPYSALVLGCTHYILIQDIIQSLLPPGVIMLEPSAAIARQTETVLTQHRLLSDVRRPDHCFITTGQAASVSRVASKLLKSRIIFTSCRL